MKFIKKYDYASLKRQDGEYRIYLTPDGESLPSVTSVLSKTKDKTGLYAWRKRVGEKKAEKVMEDAARIGTALPVYIDHFVNGNPYGDLTPAGVEAELMAKKIIEDGLKDVDEVWGSEVSLYYPGKYAGTTDMVGLYKGRPAIIDFISRNESNTP